MPILGVVGEIALMAAVGAVVGFVTNTFSDKATNPETTETEASGEIYFNEYEDEEIPKITDRRTF